MHSGGSELHPLPRHVCSNVQGQRRSIESAPGKVPKYCNRRGVGNQAFLCKSACFFRFFLHSVTCIDTRAPSRVSINSSVWQIFHEELRRNELFLTDPTRPEHVKPFTYPSEVEEKGGHWTVIFSPSDKLIF